MGCRRTKPDFSNDHYPTCRTTLPSMLAHVITKEMLEIQWKSGVKRTIRRTLGNVIVKWQTGSKNQGTSARGRALSFGAEEARPDPNINDGMDWLSNYKAEIICHKKVVRIPLSDGKLDYHLVGKLSFEFEYPKATPATKSRPIVWHPSELEECRGQLKELQRPRFHSTKLIALGSAGTSRIGDTKRQSSTGIFPKGYGHLEEIEVRRSDQKLYKFKEGDFPRLHLNDIEDMLLLVIQNRLSNLEGDVIVHFAAALPTKRNTPYPSQEKCKEDLSRRSPYTTLSNPQGVIYEDKLNMKRLMHSDELYKFSDGTL
ncbi:hypothetical protein Tco_0874098 [Tanacetum coccineum]|uniref:Uncharacterized protein n=1 Tax=Tanacetum coccineum TaxID=301880 RepID=A0ABQ5BNH5_9ASTR